MLFRKKKSAKARRNFYAANTKGSELGLLLVEDWNDDSGIFCNE